MLQNYKQLDDLLGLLCSPVRNIR